ncbi:RNA polymerase sigma factor [Pontibacter chitinilyticus]|uniref:RNA polymerase sigma factor n=1 Tax=Pontibacter chitinilyticus TaxID=2674989 RepID=UPI00321BC602
MIQKMEVPGGDAVLWDNFRSGREEAFALIYDKYAEVLYSYGCGINPDKELVKDCLQDLFVTIWQSRHTLGATDSIRYYLFRAMRRQIVQKCKQQRNLTAESLPDVAESSFEEKWISLENETYTSRMLEAALKQLSDRQREAVHLRFYQKMEFDEIAALMDITPRAVYKLIYRAVDVLQKYYDTFCTTAEPASEDTPVLLQFYTFFLLFLLYT